MAKKKPPQYPAQPAEEGTQAPAGEAKPKKAPPNFTKRTDIPLQEVAKAYLSWDWTSLEQLAQMIEKETGKKISDKYLSHLAIKHKWQETRNMILATGVGVNGAATIKSLYQEGKDFDPVKALRGMQSRIVKVIAAELITRNDPVYFKGMAEFYDLIQVLLTKTHQHNIAMSPPDPTPPAPPEKPKPEDENKVINPVQFGSFARGRK